MTRDDIVATAKELGYTHVGTAGGPVSLDEWAPYGWPTYSPEFTLNRHRGRIEEELPDPLGAAVPVHVGSWPLIRA